MPRRGWSRSELRRSPSRQPSAEVIRALFYLWSSCSRAAFRPRLGPFGRLGLQPRRVAHRPQAAERPELAATATATLVFRSIFAGESHSCGVTTDKPGLLLG